jgi:hypothetical protein
LLKSVDELRREEERVGKRRDWRDKKEVKASGFI